MKATTKLRRTKNPLDKTVREKVSPMLQAALATGIDVALQAKQAHWNVRGPSFIGLHKLFDAAAAEAHEHADMIAERLAQLGGECHGRASDVAKNSALDPYPAEVLDQKAHVEAFSNALSKFSGQCRDFIDKADEAGDPDTADLFTNISRNVDKTLWFVEAHLG
jgi:starvation-inducible DNA-binding protein